MFKNDLCLALVRKEGNILNTVLIKDEYSIGITNNYICIESIEGKVDVVYKPDVIDIYYIKQVLTYTPGGFCINESDVPVLLYSKEKGSLSGKDVFNCVNSDMSDFDIDDDDFYDDCDDIDGVCDGIDDDYDDIDDDYDDICGVDLKSKSNDGWVLHCDGMCDDCEDFLCCFDDVINDEDVDYDDLFLNFGGDSAEEKKVGDSEESVSLNEVKLRELLDDFLNSVSNEYDSVLDYGNGVKAIVCTDDEEIKKYIEDIKAKG